MLAKIWSEQNKPNGQFILPNEHSKIQEFMQDLNIRKIPGVGRVHEEELKRLGITKWSDILNNIVEIYVTNNERTTAFL